MGDPRRLSSKSESPRKVWDSARITKERKLLSAYGMKKTREIWRALYDLKKARGGAMKYLSQGEGGQKGGALLMRRLARLGIISPDAKLDDVLSLTVENFLDRRLQTRVMKKGLARTPKQARQLITHGYIAVKGRRVTVPSYLVTTEEEALISYFKPIDITVHVPDPAQKVPRKAAPVEQEGEKAEAAA